MYISLSDLAAIGSLVSGFAVLVSLLYLNLQARQTERNQRALINQGAMARDTAMVQMLHEPHFATAMARVIEGETSFTTLEIWHLTTVLRGLIGSLQEAWLQKRAGLIDAVTIDYIELGVHYYLSMPLFVALWSLGRKAYPAETVAQVDALIARLRPAEPVDLGAVLTARLANV